MYNHSLVVILQLLDALFGLLAHSHLQHSLLLLLKHLEWAGNKHLQVEQVRKRKITIFE